MNRRFFLATVATLIGLGLVGARPGRAQQPAPAHPETAPAPSPAPAPAPSPTPAAPPSIEPDPGPAPPDFPAEPEAKAKPVGQVPKGEGTPVSPADPFLPETVPPSDPKVDEDLMRVRDPADAANPLPPAQPSPGTAGPSSSGASPDPRNLPLDRLPMDSSSAGITIEVQAPPTANLNRPLKFRILVKNTGQSPALGVTVSDRLPQGLQFDKSEPPASAPVGDVYSWRFDTLPVGAEKVITVTTIPRQVGDFDHVPTVTLSTGSRSRTLVKNPQLKVEITHQDGADVLKGRPVKFNVTVRNTGTGPARSVIVHANLTGGLKHDSGSSIEVAFKDYLGRDTLPPGESEVIPLEVDTVSGGEQTCSVYAESPDVQDATEAKAESKIRVVEPLLDLQVSGPSERRTNSTATYHLIVRNPGTATARKVVAAAFIPLDGKLQDSSPSNLTYEPTSRRLYWRVGDLEAGAEKEMTFDILLGGISLFKVDGGCRAEGLSDKFEQATTHVVGMPDIDCQFVAQTTIMDVGETPVFEIRLTNRGSKGADKVLVKATLPPNLEVVETDGHEGKVKTNSLQVAEFPPLDLPPGAKKTLFLRVRAKAAGKDISTVAVTYGDDFKIQQSITTRVTDPK